MKKKLWITLFIILPIFLNAQVSSSGLSNADSFGNSVYGLGLSAGWASGVGISFREHLPTKASLEAIFGIIKTDKLLMSIGGEFQYDLVRGPKTRFFGVSALSYQYWGSKGNDISGTVPVRRRRRGRISDSKFVLHHSRRIVYVLLRRKGHSAAPACRALLF